MEMPVEALDKVLRATKAVRPIRYTAFNAVMGVTDYPTRVSVRNGVFISTFTDLAFGIKVED